MKALWLSTILMLSGVAFAAGSMKIEIPGFSIRPLSNPGGEEWWMPSTKPLELSRYALTNETVTHPILVTILRYASSQQAKMAFQMSWGGRPAAPREMKLPHWEAAHKWQTAPRGIDVCLLKRNYVVGVYDLPSDSAEKTDGLLDALADIIAKAEPVGAENGSQPNRSGTNSTSSAAVVVEGFTFKGIPRAWSKTGLIVDVEKVTKGSFSERQVVFGIDPNQHTPPPLKIGVRYSITCTFGIGGDYRWFGYKIQDFHEVE